MKYPSKETLENFQVDLDQIKSETLDSLGQKDVTHIKNMILKQRKSEIAGRALLMGGLFPPFWLAGTALLGYSKILDNMEIGHNVMHGQYDWMNDPAIHSSKFEWDTACDGASWKRTHNFEHHTYTNIIDKDRDYGYGLLRLDNQNPWKPSDLLNTTRFALLSIFFQWGVALHELEVEKLISKEITLKEKRSFLNGFFKKGGRQVFKDYLFFPSIGILTGAAIPVLLGNITANLIRNIWASSVIFCGHFPDGVHTFTEEESKNETKGQWYYRQILGSCNFEGGNTIHELSGHLSYQVEHHLFPDIPAHRYPEMAIRVKAVCAKYNIPYNSAPLSKQYATVIRKVFKYSFPDLHKKKLAIA